MRRSLMQLHNWSTERWEDNLREVDKVSSRASITLIEGTLGRIMGNVKEKDQRRIKVGTQSAKLKKIKDWETMIHPKLLEFVRSSIKVC